jgi:hypothetical protein
VQECLIRNFLANGISFNPTATSGLATSALYVSDTRVTAIGDNGISVFGSGAYGEFDRIAIDNVGNNGLSLGSGSEFFIVRDSTIAKSIGNGLIFNPGSGGPFSLTVSDTYIGFAGGSGINISAAGADVGGAINRVAVEATGGLQLGPANTLKFTVSNSVIAANSAGIAVSGSGSSVILSNADVSGNSSYGVNADTNGVIRMTRSRVGTNATGLQTATGGQIISFGDNVIDGNTTDGTPTSTLPLK